MKTRCVWLLTLTLIFSGGTASPAGNPVADTGLDKRHEPDHVHLVPEGIGEGGAYTVHAKEGNRGVAITKQDDSRPHTMTYKKRWAVVIGINDYKSWPRLRYAVNDARAVAEKLKELGFDEIITLTDKAATKIRIEETLNGLKDQVGPEDGALIFYAGHGMTETFADGSKMGYWIPVDGHVKNFIATAISMDNIRLFSQAIPARHVLYIIDACYSGLALRQKWLAEGERLTRQVITAGRSGEEVLEKEGHGLFTGNLLEALEGGADLTGDGAITASELGIFLQSKALSAFEGRQQPLFGKWSGEEDFIVSMTNGATASPPRRPASSEAQITPGGEQASLPSARLRVMVVIPEVLDGTPVLTPSGEAAVIGRLVEGGYNVLDQGQIDEIRNPREVKNILSSGNTAPARAVGRQYGVDLIIIGEGTGQNAGKILNSMLISSRARIQARIINTATGQIIASEAIDAAGVDIVPAIAGKKALSEAGSQLAEVLIGTIKNLNQ